MNSRQKDEREPERASGGFSSSSADSSNSTTPTSQTHLTSASISPKQSRDWSCNFGSQPQSMQLAQAQSLVTHLSTCNDSSRKQEAEIMQNLRTLRNCIQSHTAAARVFAQAGAIQMLLKRLEQKFENQVMVLQILAALGYLVQSEDRAEIFVKENGIDVLVKLLKSDHSSEAILLLGVQVMSFVVYNSEQRLELLQSKRGIDTMCSVLQRGCVRSALLNDKATKLLGKLIDLNPRRGPALCCRLLKRISQLVSRYEAWEPATPNIDDRVAQQLRTLVKSLGTLLDKKPDRCEAVLNSSGADVFFKLMNTKKSSANLIQTVTETLAHCIEGDPSRALKVENMEASSRLLEVVETSKTNEKLMNACARNLNLLLVAICASPERRPKAEEICMRLGNTLLHQSTTIYATPNAMRVIRQLVQAEGPAFEIFRSTGVLHQLVSLAETIIERPDLLKDNVQQDVLQELGLLVEGDERSALSLAEAGALKVLYKIIAQGRSSHILCAATRALACFVEHDGENGLAITDIATKSECDKALLDLITKSNCRTDIDDEVLLNTVGALGYMVKRQKPDVAPHDLGTRAERRHKACVALVTILNREKSSESLLWNVTWALIYLMDSGKEKDCVTAVLEARGFEALKNLMMKEDGSPTILDSAARALNVILGHSPGKVMELNMNVRMTLLSTYIRSEPGDSEGCDNAFPETAGGSPMLTLDIDQADLARTSICELEEHCGKELRSKGIRVHYTSKEIDQVGIDAGGLRRDWLSRLSAEVFDPTHNLVIWGFNPRDSVQISPNPELNGMSEDELKSFYKMMGRLLGLSILYQDPLGVALSPPVCKLIFDINPEFEDLKYISESYYNTFKVLNDFRVRDKEAFEAGLLSLPTWKEDESKDLVMKEAFERCWDEQEDTVLQKLINSKATGDPLVRKQLLKDCKSEKYFKIQQVTEALTIARQKKDRTAIKKLTELQNSMLDKNKEVSVKKRRLSLPPAALPEAKKLKRVNSNDNEKVVTAKDYDRYLTKLQHKLLVDHSKKQIGWVKKGLHEIIRKELLSLFLTPKEFGQLIEGDRDISIASWKLHTQYRGGDEDTKQVQWFWEYVEKLDRGQRQKVLQWSTGWRSIGNSGFAHRKFTIELTEVSSKIEDERLPSVATCGFHMWLPKYSKKERLQSKFERAICETAFGNC